MCGEGFICRFSSDFCKSTLPPLVLSVAYPASPAGHSPLAASCLPNFPWPPPIHSTAPCSRPAHRISGRGVVYCDATAQKVAGCVCPPQPQPALHLHAHHVPHPCSLLASLLRIRIYCSGSRLGTCSPHLHPTATNLKKDLKHELPARFYFYPSFDRNKRQKIICIPQSRYLCSCRYQRQNLSSFTRPNPVYGG